MMKEAILHQPFGSYAYAVSSHDARIVLRAKKGDLTRVSVAHVDRYMMKGTYATMELERAGSDELYDYFHGVIRSKTRRISYRFLLEDGVERLWYGDKGFGTDGEAVGWFQLSYLATADLYHVPEWVNEAVVYQIFPDRFHNGDPTNDPEGVLPWGELPRWDTFFGGDLQGIIEKLDYLEDLGVNLLYLTPIFLSPSTHKYDTIDYYQIDPMFGDLETVKTLVAELHKRGMRIVLDAVFNHCGAQFPPFLDVLEKGEQSKYKDWFHLHSFPVDTKTINYETFAIDVATMPKLRTENPEVRDYLLKVGEYWVKEIGIDGWRLDVANEVDHDFWRAFRKTVRAANEDCLIIGEVFHDASPWLHGDQWDGVMNYLFRDVMLDFFAKRKLDAVGFDEKLTSTRLRYKEQSNRAMFNLLGSHDVERFLTACDEKVERMRLAVLFQMCYVGMPEVYYGDEVGMVGKTDPDCRRTMLWNEEEQNAELLNWHKQLIRLRKSHPALQTGAYRTVLTDALHNVYGFVRENEQESLFIVLNNGEYAASVALPTAATYTDLLSGETVVGSFELAAMDGKVLLRNE